MEKFLNLLDAIIEKLKTPFSHGTIILHVENFRVRRSEVTVGRLHD